MQAETMSCHDVLHLSHMAGLSDPPLWGGGKDGPELHEVEALRAVLGLEVALVDLQTQATTTAPYHMSTFGTPPSELCVPSEKCRLALAMNVGSARRSHSAC